MSYVVDAPLVLVHDQEGKVHHCYKDAVIPWLAKDEAEHLQELGFVHKVGAASSSDESDAGGSGDDEKPAKVATKAVLVDWLVGHGEYDRAELEEQTKDELWALIEATD